MNEQIRSVLLVDDHPLFRAGVRQVIESDASFRVGGEAASVAEAVTLAGDASFDVAVVDLSLPDGSGLGLISWLKNHDVKLPVLVLSMHNSAEFVRRAFRNGASGYVTKGSSAAELHEALRTVVDGGVFAGSEVAQLLIGATQDGGQTDAIRHRLTVREVQVAEALAEGWTAAEVATTLGISPKTVEAHRGNIYRKLDVRNVAELTRLVATEPETSQSLEDV